MGVSNTETFSVNYQINTESVYPPQYIYIFLLIIEFYEGESSVWRRNNSFSPCCDGWLRQSSADDASKERRLHQEQL